MHRGSQELPQEGQATCARVGRGHVVLIRFDELKPVSQPAHFSLYIYAAATIPSFTIHALHTCTTITTTVSIQGTLASRRLGSLALHIRRLSRRARRSLHTGEKEARKEGMRDAELRDRCSGALTTVKTTAPLSVSLHKRIVAPRHNARTPSSCAVWIRHQNVLRYRDLALTDCIRVLTTLGRRKKGFSTSLPPINAKFKAHLLERHRHVCPRYALSRSKDHIPLRVLDSHTVAPPASAPIPKVTPLGSF